MHSASGWLLYPGGGGGGLNSYSFSPFCILFLVQELGWFAISSSSRTWFPYPMALTVWLFVVCFGFKQKVGSIWLKLFRQYVFCFLFKTTLAHSWAVIYPLVTSFRQFVQAELGWALGSKLSHGYSAMPEPVQSIRTLVNEENCSLQDYWPRNIKELDWHHRLASTLKKFYGRHHDLVCPYNVADSRIISDVFATDKP